MRLSFKKAEAELWERRIFLKEDPRGGRFTDEGDIVFPFNFRMSSEFSIGLTALMNKHGVVRRIELEKFPPYVMDTIPLEMAEKISDVIWFYRNHEGPLPMIASSDGACALPRESSNSWRDRIRQVKRGMEFDQSFQHDEGFPLEPWEGAVFDLILATGEMPRGRVDDSGLCSGGSLAWSTADGRITKDRVAAWLRIPTSVILAEHKRACDIAS